MAGAGFLLLCISTVSAAFRPEIGTRALGMSGAFIGAPDDSTGALWNPAGLANLQTGNLVYDFSQGAFSFGYPIRRIGTLGFSVLDLNGGDRFFVRHPNNPIGTFERGSNQVLLSYARRIGMGVQMGGNISYSRAPYTGSSWARSYDLGAILELNSHLTLGARLIDISGVAISDSRGRMLQQFEPQFALGATWKPVRLLQVNGALDTALWRLKTGMEIGAYGLAIRWGTAIDLRRVDEPPDWSLGFSIDLHGRQIHYAYLNDSDVEHKHFLAIGVTFGSPTRKRTATGKSEKKQTVPRQEQSPIDSREETVSSATEIAQQYGVELELIQAMVKVESNFNPNLVSSAGAGGLTQLMPQTAQELGLKVPTYRNAKKPNPNPEVDERFAPYKNLEAGTKYLSAMLRKYDGNYVLALAAYNAGPGNVQKNVPLIRETERHVGKVLNAYYRYKAQPTLRDIDLHKLDAILNEGKNR